MDVKEVRAQIIRTLVQWGKWGGAHTEHILRGLPKHLRGAKVTKRAIKQLVKDGWLLSAVKTSEIHYALNPRKSQEIMEFYERYGKKYRD